MVKFGTVDTQTDLTGGGTLIINGTRPPTDTDGAVGDYWLDTAGKTLYGPKGAGGGYGATEFANPGASVSEYNTGGAAYTIGHNIKCLVAGRVMGIRFYKAVLAPQTSRTVRLYNTSTVALLASVATTGEGASGWQTMNFPSPISVTANLQVTVAYDVGISTGGVYTTVPVPSSLVPTHITFTDSRQVTPPGFPASTSGNGYLADVLFQPALPTWPIAIKSAP